MVLGRKVLMIVFQYLGENRGTVITKQKTQREESDDGFFFFPIGDFSSSPTFPLLFLQCEFGERHIVT